MEAGGRPSCSAILMMLFRILAISLSFATRPADRDVKEGREGDGDGLIMLLKPAALLLERLDVSLLGRNDLHQGQHLFGQGIHGSVHVGLASQVFNV